MSKKELIQRIAHIEGEIERGEQFRKQLEKRMRSSIWGVVGGIVLVGIDFSFLGFYIVAMLGLVMIAGAVFLRWQSGRYIKEVNEGMIRHRHNLAKAKAELSVAK